MEIRMSEFPIVGFTDKISVTRTERKIRKDNIKIVLREIWCEIHLPQVVVQWLGCYETLLCFSLHQR